MSDSIKDYLNDSRNFYLPVSNKIEEKETDLSQEKQIHLLKKLKKKHLI